MRYVIGFCSAVLFGLVSCGDTPKSAVCGDRIVDSGEACDDGGESATCNANCTAVSCGDGVFNAAAGEVCDDGNTADRDGCSANCRSNETCGNRYIDTALGETCDDGNKTPGDGCSEMCAIKPVEPTIFWVNSNVSLRRAAGDGADAGEVLTGAKSVIAVDPKTRTLFFDRGNPTNIARANLDGSNPVDIVTGVGTVAGLAVDSVNGKLYWTDFGSSRLMRSDLDGANRAQVVATAGSPSGLALDVANSKVFFLTYNQTALYSVKYDGTGLTTLASALGGQGLAVAVDSSKQKVYYSLRGNDVYVRNTDGSNPVTLVTGQGTVQGLGIDVAGGKVYWAASSAQMIRRANLADGGNVEDVSASNGNGFSLAVLPAPMP